MKTKKPLRSSKDIYDRLRWDPGVPVTEVFVGYIDRMVGLKEIPFSEFKPGGRIPWDRLQHYRMGEIMIWDRQNRIDRIFGSGETAESEKIEFQGESAWFGVDFKQVPWYQYDPWEKEWKRQTRPAAPRRVEKFSALTWNILCDEFNPWRIQSHLRYPVVFRILKEQNADIIALQEVQYPFLEALLKEPWVQESYIVSEIGQEATIEGQGQLILTRLPAESLWMLDLGGPKRFLTAVIPVNGQRLAVTSLHLTSNRAEEAEKIRENQIKRIQRGLPPDAHHLWLGDFNFGQEADHLLPEAYQDLWPQLRPNDPGLTFVPAKNHIAKEFSLSGLSRRYDRILLRALEAGIEATAIEMIGQEEIEGAELPLHPSDHWGVKAELRVAGEAPTSRAGTTVKSALAYLPPQDIWEAFQSLRRQFDPSFVRWMPHINLLYGFLPESEFEEAVPVIEEILAGWEPFSLTFQGVNFFRHSSSASLYLEPDPASTRHLQKLQAELREAFPQCTGQNRQGDFIPHLTVAKLKGKTADQAREWVETWNAHFTPVTCEVSALSLIAREENTPFEVKHSLPFAGQPLENIIFKASLREGLGRLGLWPAPLETQLRTQEIANVRNLVRKTEAKARLHVIGSEAMGIALPGGDIDMLVEGGMLPQQFFAGLMKKLEKRKGLRSARLIADALVPILKLNLNGVEMDIQYLSSLQEPTGWQDPLRSAIQEPDCIREHLGEQYENWQVLARTIKAWARVRQLDQAVYGLIPGLAWAVLTASIQQETSPEAGLEAVLERLTDWDWNQPITLEGTAVPLQQEDRDFPLQIITSAPPRFNITRQTLGSMKGLLALEGLMALERWEEDGLDGLLKPVVWGEPQYIVVGKSGTSREDEAIIQGWMNRKMGFLLADLEEVVGETLRPYPVTPEPGTVLIGISGVLSPELLQRVKVVAEDWVQQFHKWKDRPKGGRITAEYHLGSPF